MTLKLIKPNSIKNEQYYTPRVFIFSYTFM